MDGSTFGGRAKTGISTNPDGVSNFTNPVTSEMLLSDSKASRKEVDMPGERAPAGVKIASQMSFN